MARRYTSWRAFTPMISRATRRSPIDCRMNSLLSILCAILVLVMEGGCRRSVQTSSGMAPTIAAGERVTINYAAYALSEPRRWDVVALHPPDNTNAVVLKRVIALPSETVSLTASGIVINGKTLKMPPALSNVTYCPPERLPRSQAGMLVAFPYSVPLKYYFVVGDNWTSSLDSRYYGAVSVTNILGRVENK
jgi:signal peptidase I